MKTWISKLLGGTAACVAIAASALPVAAQEVLPRPAQVFNGTIGLTVATSKADFPKPVQAPKGGSDSLSVQI